MRIIINKIVTLLLDKYEYLPYTTLMKDTNGVYIKGKDLLLMDGKVLYPCDTETKRYMKEYMCGRYAVIVIDSKLYCAGKEFVSSKDVTVIDRMVNPEWYV